MRKQPKPFSSLEDDIIRVMKDEGESYTAIADKLGRSRNSIIGHWHGKLKRTPAGVE